jgi:uncharacterized membrane protein YphA (DoxX/SURF4 family)
MPNNEQPPEQLCDEPKHSQVVLRVASWVVRVALAATFLSAVADRFGLWGPPGTPAVAWGSIEQYESYVGLLNWFLPEALISPVGWIATILEILLAVVLLIGWQLRWFALATAVLLTLFATAMLVSLGPKPPLDYSVFTAASAAFLLYATETVRHAN